MSWDLNKVYNALNLNRELKNNFKFNNFSIDSRNINYKSLFIPLKGETFDGHNFIDDAASRGVQFSLVEKKKKHLVKNKNINLIEVSDTYNSLIKLAKHAKNKINKLKIICVTGSSGKTTIKEWLTKILEKNFIVYSNPGNFNNYIGMPLTLVNIPEKTQICILELGMNKCGEIKNLVEIARPDISIVTNIGNAHIGNFKNSLEIAQEKSDIFEFFTKKSIAIIPGDSEFIDLIKSKALKKTLNVYKFGSDKNCDSTYKVIEKNRISFLTLKKKIDLEKKINFKNWEINISIILIVLKVLNLNFRKFAANLEKLKPLSGRGQLRKVKKDSKNLYVIDESYNSSPNALISAIENLNETKFRHNRKVLVIGDMLELGKFSEKMHKKIIPTIIKVQPSVVITIGNYSKIISDNLPKNIKTFHFKKIIYVYNRLVKEIKNNDIIMIKGSNAIKLSHISKTLCEGN